MHQQQGKDTPKKGWEMTDFYSNYLTRWLIFFN